MIKNTSSKIAFCSKAPFRLGLAGGGTDVSPFSELHGGAVVNATVSLYARTTIKPRDDNKILIKYANTEKVQEFPDTSQMDYNGTLDLAKGVYNIISQRFPFEHEGFELTVSTDVPTGSGLGTSSTIVVSIIGAFIEWLGLDLKKQEVAQLAYEIEREELKMAGGKQDQYTATFGGLNFMRFVDDKVFVEPIEVKRSFLENVNKNLILFFMDSKRKSGKIIEEQINNVKQNKLSSVQAMLALKENALEMKSAFEQGNSKTIGHVLHKTWLNKKKMANRISNATIETFYGVMMSSGALGGKISGAGGGGFMIIYAPQDAHSNIRKALKKFSGRIVDFSFTDEGLTTWTEQ